MRKLTKAQAAALAKIEDNPGGVEAITRLRTDMLRINGNAEHSLERAGLIEKRDVAEMIRTVGGKEHRIMIRAWKLTAEGADALHAATHKAA